MKAVTLDKVIALSRDSIKVQQEQLAVLDKVFVAMQQHLDAQRKRNHLPKLVSVNGEMSNDGR
jgi:hypothetical protein